MRNGSGSASFNQELDLFPHLTVGENIVVGNLRFADATVRISHMLFRAQPNSDVLICRAFGSWVEGITAAYQLELSSAQIVRLNALKPASANATTREHGHRR